jgi:hypothetical protein
MYLSPRFHVARPCEARCLEPFAKFPVCGLNSEYHAYDSLIKDGRRLCMRTGTEAENRTGRGDIGPRGTITTVGVEEEEHVKPCDVCFDFVEVGTGYPPTR